jgi:hypothetical protein
MDSTDLTYAACGGLVVMYAWGRFNTPPSNRSSTRRALYWSSCAGYILTALAIFALMSSLLQVAAWRTALLGKTDNATLPAPLIATLAMTTLLSSVPILKRLDGWILAAFLDWGAIPAEARRRAATLTPQSFNVTADDIARLREAYGDSGYGDTLVTHLRAPGSEGLEASEYHLTRVVKLYDYVQSLSGVPRYARFFTETAAEFEEINRRVTLFLRRADTSLTLGVRLRALEGQSAYEELMHDRREDFARACRDTFRELGSFLARAVLRSEPNEREIVHRLRDFGFAAAALNSEPEFPINSLTLLGLGIFVYLAMLTVFFSHLPHVAHPPGSGIVMALKVALARLITIGVVIWLMQRFAFFRRKLGDPPKYFAYVISGVITSAVAAAVCLPFVIGNPDGPLNAMRDNLPVIALSAMLCAILAFCCDDWPKDSAAPIRLRFAEAGGCAAVVAFGTSLMYFGDMLPTQIGDLTGWMAVAWIVLPSTMALIIGGFVPHIYRSARRAAAARQGEGLRGMPAHAEQPRQPPGPPLPFAAVPAKGTVDLSTVGEAD